MNLVPEISESRLAFTLPRARAVVTALWELCKPRITVVVLATTWLGAVIAPSELSAFRLSVGLAGTALVVAGANALNMFLEVGPDARMQRTRSRPLPSGRLSAEVAFLFALCTSVVGLALLSRWVGAAAAVLAAAAFLSYALIYTPLKPYTPYALHVGAVPGAMPPLIGWVSAGAPLDGAALSLFLILFLWQLPHFMAIALFRGSEYAHAKIAVYPLAYGEARTRRAMTFWSICLVGATILPWALGVAGLGYALWAGVIGISFLALVVFGRRFLPEERWAKTVFAASIPHLILIYGGLAVAV